MTLDDIAAGIEVTVEQEDRGVAAVDDTGADVASRLEPFAEALPCDLEAAADLVAAYAEGASVGAAARRAGLAPTTGAKTLHRLGEPVSPLTPSERVVVDDFLAARVSRTEAIRLVGDEADFVLGVYARTHDPLPGAGETLEGLLAPGSTGADPLGEARSEVDDLL
ncbi:MAG: hypothetical protein V5A62_00705 [Haloarculaceae archaeon]